MKNARRPKVSPPAHQRPPAKWPGLAARRIAADISTACCAAAVRSTNCSTGARSRPRASRRSRPRADAGAGRRRAAPARHAAPSARALSRARLPPQAPRVETALLIGAAQILFLDVPDHAAVDLAVRLVQADRHAGISRAWSMPCCGASRAKARALLADARYAACSTRRLADGALDAALMAHATAHAIAAANSHEPALDLTVKSEADAWAAQLGGRVLPTGTVRMLAHGPMTALPGFAEGAWWVQDAAAALPARLFGDVADAASPISAPRRAARPRSLQPPARMSRRSTARRRGSSGLRDNLARLSLTPSWSAPMSLNGRAEPFDAVLLDAPCSSTGTIRRHPDMPWLKRDDDITALAGAAAPLDRARRSADQARRHAGLLHLLARARGERGRRCRASWRENRICGAVPIARRRIVRSWRRFITGGRRPAHAALPVSRRRFAIRRT